MSAVSHSHFHSEADHSHHDHTHGTIDPELLTTERGIWAVKWSLVGLTATAVFQLVIVIFSGSVALLADTIHNIADAATAIPLWIAFSLARRQPSRRFTYGYGRVEDLAGVVIVLTILFSAVVAGYESINRFLHAQAVKYLWAVAVASIIGFAGSLAGECLKEFVVAILKSVVVPKNSVAVFEAKKRQRLWIAGRASSIS